MIRIAVADTNPIYCQGLKTMLRQVDDFRIVVLSPDSFNTPRYENLPIDILLVDADLYLGHQGNARGRALPVPEAKTILLIMDPDELPGRTRQVRTLRKGSGKHDFEAMIRKVSAGF